MVGFVKALVGAFFILFAIFFRFYFFTNDVLTQFGMSATDIYNLTQKMKIFDPFYYMFTVGLGLAVIVWGVTQG